MENNNTSIGLNKIIIYLIYYNYFNNLNIVIVNIQNEGRSI